MDIFKGGAAKILWN